MTTKSYTLADGTFLQVHDGYFGGFKLDPDLKAQWLAALRSGKYAHGTIALRRGNSFCCLGVLADVVNPAGWESQGFWRASKDINFRVCSSYLPSFDPSLPRGVQHELAKINDREKSFDLVIQVIDENL